MTTTSGTTHTSDTLTALSTLIRDRYVFPDVAEQIVAALPREMPDTTPAERGALLTEAVQSVNHDRHLRVRPRGSGPAASAHDEAASRAEARRNAGGLRTVRRIDERTGLLELAPVMSPVHLAEPYVGAAFALLNGIDALVLDLRACRGGHPETVASICSHLLGTEPVHLQDLIDRDGRVRQQSWTLPTSGSLGADVAVAVAIGELTFSGGEELAYDLQALGRAPVFGRASAGGAHPVERVELDDSLEVTVPVERSVNAVTGTNWEQTGVVPDVECSSDEALDRALAWLRAATDQPG